MRIVFDIDGTLTNFEQFIIKHRFYIEKKYGIQLTNKHGYDIDEMFDIKNKKVNEGYSEQEAIEISNAIMKDFWNKYYVKYSIFSKFRKDVRQTINELRKEGNEICIATSRRKTTEKNILGFLVRMSTKLSFKLNGVKYDQINFFDDDESKKEYIKRNNFDALIDDKPEMILSLKDNIKCYLISSNYNENVLEEDNVIRINNYKKLYDKLRIDNFIKSKDIKNFKLYKKVKKTERNYKIIKKIGTIFVKKMYNPIILDENKIDTNESVIYAPNHRKTLDPFFVVMSSDDAIHWAALKRFFDGQDSIFNNSKNPFLCKATQIIFKEIGLIPVDRGGDTSETLAETNYYLSNGSSVGIFPEGTTNKNPDIQDLLEIKKGLLHFAKDNDAMIQPISIVWNLDKNMKNRVIINYRKPYSMQNLTIEEGKDKWIQEVTTGIRENEKMLKTISDKQKIKTIRSK